MLCPVLGGAAKEGEEEALKFDAESTEETLEVTLIKVFSDSKVGGATEDVAACGDREDAA